MDSNYCVSVVVPIYNQEAYLRKSIPAILNQSYSNLEIILVNDGSTDNSIEIMKEYAISDSRIKIIEKTNGGLVDATVTGIEACTGELLCFLDPDDYWGSDFVENFVNAMDNAYDFISAGYYIDDGIQNTAVELQADRVYYTEEIKKLRKRYLFDGKNLQVSMEIFISRWNKIYKTQTVKRITNSYMKYKDVTLGEDTIFTYLFLNVAKTAKTCSWCNSYYYNVVNQNSMMNNTSSERHLKKSYYAFEKFSELLKSKNDPEIQAIALYYFLSNRVLRNRAFNKKSNDDLKTSYAQALAIYQKLNNLSELNFASRWCIFQIKHPVILKLKKLFR